jgi:hypothetical protein
MGGAMAAHNLNSAERLHVYEDLFRLNRSFANIVRKLLEMQDARVFNPNRLRELRGLTKELQSEINFHLLNTLHEIETADRYRFGKVRIAKDKRLHEPLPEFRR